MKTYFTVILVSFTSLSHSLPKSGRRSDGLSHHTVQRKELKYSAPPRGRGGGRTNLEGNHFEPTAHHFIPTAPSVYAQSRSSNHHIVQYEAVSTTATHPTTIQPMVFSPMLDNARDQLNMSRIDQEDLVSEICKFSHHSLCDLFRPKSPISQTKPKIEPQNYDLKIREEHPDPKTEEEKQRFKYRHNYPYRRQPKPGDFGLRRSTVNYVPVTTESVGYHGQFGYQPAPTEQPRYKEKFGFHPESPVYSEPQNYPEHFGPHPATTQRPRYQEGVVHYPIQTESPPNIAGPFVTVQKESENITDIARQPKQADDIFVDYGSDSRLNEVRVLPPEEFRHLLAQVDGIDRKDDSNADSVASESRRRPRQSKFRGVPGTAGRDFPTLGSIPMTSFSCIGTKAGFYADIEANCQVYHYCHFDGRQDSFLCSNGTVFNQKVFTCDWWYNVNCAASEDLYSLNDNLYKDGSSLFGESVGGNGNDFDLSKLQSLLKRNTLEIDNLLSSSSKRDLLNSPLRSSLSLDSSLPLSLLRSSTKLENSISKKSGPSGKSLRFSDITAARFLEPEVKSASSPLGKDDITVSYESRPSGGFSVFYTVPKEPLEASKVDKIKDLIQSINKKTLLKENLKNSINDYEDDYYEDDDYESDYYVEDTLTNLKTLKNPPDLSDDYYDPGPPASYYDDIPEYIGEEDDEYNDYDYDYEEDYEEDYDDDYYDVAEDRMMIESSTMNPMVLSPTIQQLNALTHKQLGNNYLKKRKLSRKKKKKSIERRMDTQGKLTRPKRWALWDVHSNNVKTSAAISVNDNNAIDLNNIDTSDMQMEDSSLDPSLYDVNMYDYPYEQSMDASEYIPYPEGDDVYYDDFEEEDFLSTFGRPKDVPIVQRTWLDNVLKYRDSLFGKPQYKTEHKKNPTFSGGKPQVNIHYPDSNNGPFVTITKARRPPLKNKPNVFVSGGDRTRNIPPVVSIQSPNSIISPGAISSSQPATTLSRPSTTISQPAVSISQPVTTFSQPATTISQPALSIQTPEFDFSQPAVDFVSSDFSARMRQSPLGPSTLNTLGRLRVATGGGRNPITTTRLLSPDDIPEEGLDYYLEEYEDQIPYHDESHHSKPDHKNGQYHQKGYEYHNAKKIKHHHKKDNHYYHEKENDYHHEKQNNYQQEKEHKHLKGRNYQYPEEVYNQETLYYPAKEETYHDESYHHKEDQYPLEKHPYHQKVNSYYHKQDNYHQNVDPYYQKEDTYHHTKNPHPHKEDPYLHNKDNYLQEEDSHRQEQDSYHPEEEPYHHEKDPYHHQIYDTTYNKGFDGYEPEPQYDSSEYPEEKYKPKDYHSSYSEYKEEKLYDPYEDEHLPVHNSFSKYEPSQEIYFGKQTYEIKERDKHKDHISGKEHIFEHTHSTSYGHPHFLPEKQKKYPITSKPQSYKEYERNAIFKEPQPFPRKHYKHEIMAPPTSPILPPEEYHHSTSAIYETETLHDQEHNYGKEEQSYYKGYPQPPSYDPYSSYTYKQNHRYASKPTEASMQESKPMSRYKATYAKIEPKQINPPKSTYKTKSEYPSNPTYSPAPIYAEKPQYAPKPVYAPKPAYAPKLVYAPKPEYASKPTYTAKPNYEQQTPYAPKTTYAPNHQYAQRPTYAQKPIYVPKLPYTPKSSHRTKMSYTPKPTYSQTAEYKPISKYPHAPEHQPVVPHNYLEHRIAVQIEPKMRYKSRALDFYKRKGYTQETKDQASDISSHGMHYEVNPASEDMFIESNTEKASYNVNREKFFPFNKQLPPTLYDHSPPTLFDNVYPNQMRRDDNFSPPALNSYLPPTLFDRKPMKSAEKKLPYYPPKLHEYRTPTLFDRKYAELPENRLSRIKSADNASKYYQRSTAVQKEMGESTHTLSVGVGSKGGPEPSKIYKSQIRMLNENLYKYKKEPALKFEHSKIYRSKISFQPQEKQPQYNNSYDSNRQQDTKKTNYDYTSKIRYKNNSPVQNGRPPYSRPQPKENHISDQRKPEKSNHLEAGLSNTNHQADIHIKKDRLYRHDFPKDIDVINERIDNPDPRQAILSTVPCQGASKYFVNDCVVATKLDDNEHYKTHSSFPNIRNEIPASQVSSLPYTTQIPRPPISNGRKPYRSYEPTINNLKNTVRSLPQYPTPSTSHNLQYPNTSVRSLPQYPHQNILRTQSNQSLPNLILAKRKTRSDASNTNVP